MGINRIKPDVDVLLDILNAVVKAQPGSSFAQSLLNQYQERGSLSKKQLQGLQNKAQKVSSIPPGKLATLEAIILKRPTKEKSDLPAISPLYQKDDSIGKMITGILERYPRHKQVLFLRSKYENDEPLTVAENEELRKFSKLLK